MSRTGIDIHDERLAEHPGERSVERDERATGDAGATDATVGRSGRGVDRSLRLVGWVVVPLALLGLWQAVTAAQLFSPVALPAPGDVWSAGAGLVERGELGGHLAISTQRVLLGFGIGAVLGLLTGAALGLSRLADSLFAPSIGAFRAVPSLAWVPLLLLWLGIAETSKVTLIAIGAFFPVYTTVAAAFRHVDHHLVEVGRAYGLHGHRMLGRIMMPATMPSIVAGLRLALAQAWLFLVAAELIAASEGLGFLLVDSQNNGRTDRLLLAIVLLALLGKLTDTVIGLVERRLLRKWG